MPPIRTKANPEEGRIAKAIEALEKGEFTHVTEAHRYFNVPYGKLLHRYQGRKAANSLGGKNKLLNDAQEQAILQYIDRYDQLGRPCDHRHIELAANSVLQASGTLQLTGRYFGLPKTVSKAWTSRFIKRHNVFKHSTKPLSAQRKAAQKAEDIELHFHKFEKRYKELEIIPANLHNFDETGFRIGC